MSFLQSAQESVGGNKAEDLDDSNREESIKPREFFWDNIVLFVVSSIIGLAAIDVVTEFIRGGDVACFSPQGVELNEAQGDYINSFCSGALPQGAYIPAFMVVHAVLITLPHYLWLNHYGGNFDFFFQLASSLKRLREKGEHVQENLVIVNQLEATFSTYGRNTIFTFYILKLIVQLIFSLAGIGFVIGFFFRSFDSNFMCPRNFNNSTEYPFWPLDTEVVCVFEALGLLQTLWWAEIALLALVVFGLLWALIWCLSTHSSELGAKPVAQFSFQSGLSPVFYVPSLPVPRWLRSCFTSLPWILGSGPRIRSDLDFLLMKLYRTDNGLGHVFREVQIEKEIKILADDEQRRLHLHSSTQQNYDADNAGERKKDTRDRQQDEQDLKWRFSKVAKKKGVYRDFKTLPFTQELLLTNTMRGAVLGFGQRAPHSKNAFCISFGDHGYATALARVFGRVASINFSPHFNSSDEVVSVTQYRTSMVSLVYPENILSCGTSQFNTFIDSLRTIWVPPGSNPKFSSTSFIVIGPITKDKDFNLTTVDLLFEHIYGCLEPEAVLLAVHPLEIAGKSVEDSFISYEPSKPHFVELKQSSPTIANTDAVTEWPARKSALDAATAAVAATQTTPPTSGATLTGGQVAVQVQQPSDKYELLPSSSATSDDNLPYEFPVILSCGETKVRVRFSTYRYTNNPPVKRSTQFDPPKKEAAPLKATPAVEAKTEEKKSLVPKEKNVNLEVES